MLPGEADAAEDLERVGGHPPGRVGGAGLGHRGRQRQRLRLGVGAPGRVVGERARLLDVVEHPGAAVRDGLVGADRAVELLALLGVVDRHLHRPLGDPGQLGGERDQRPVRGRLDVAGERIAADGRDPRVSRGSRRSARPARSRRRSASTRTAPSPSFRTSTRGARRRPGRGRCSRGSNAAAPRSSPEAIPGSQRCRLLVASRVIDEQARRGVGQERRRRARVAELLAEDRQLDHPEPLAAVLLGDRDPRPAEARGSRPRARRRRRATRPPRGPSPAGSAWPASRGRSP